MNELQALRQDLKEIYVNVKTCKVCGLKYGVDVIDTGFYRDTCPCCMPENEMIKRIIKRKQEKGI